VKSEANKIKQSVEPKTAVEPDSIELVEVCEPELQLPASTEIVAASPVAATHHATAQQNKMLAKAMQDLPQKRQSNLGRRLVAHGIDCFLVAFVGAFMHAMAMHAMFSMADPHAVLSYAYGRDLIMGWVLFFLASLVPVLLPGLDALIYHSTHPAGAPTIGDFLVKDTVSTTHSLNAQALSHTPFGDVITQWLLFAPIFAMPLYKALCQASPVKASIGEAICKLQLTDENAGRSSLKDALFFNFFWFAMPIVALWERRTKSGGKPAMISAAEFRIKATDSKQIPAPRAVMLRYRAFAGLERWLRDRFADNRIAKYFSRSPAHRIAGFTLGIGVALVFPFAAAWAAIFGSIALAWLMTLLGAGASISEAAKAVNDRQNFQFVMWFYTFLMGGFAAGAFAYLRKPTDLLLEKDGMRWFWRFTKYRGTLIPWKDLEEVKLLHDRKKGSTQEDQIIFSRGSGQTLTLKASGLDSIHDKELLLAAIECWAPHLKRNAELVQTLQPPADLSYTEVWLAALTAPPKRERLKPLVEGVSLHDNAYRVVRSIGTGGQGFAYLAEHGDAKEQVVLKEFILPVFVDVSVRRKALEKFESEARLLKHLDNDQVVKLVDYFVEDHRAYLVLEYIDGISLRRLVEEKGALPQEQVLELTKQMATILEYLHNGEPPVVHRDFTPDNLILRKDGTLKLIDFNVAQQLDATVVATVVGKHAYLAPEQFQGMPGTQSDIYSMGATIHYLLTGKDPLPISVSKPKEVRADVDDLLDLVVSRATQRSLVERYAKVENLVKELWPETPF